MNVARTPIKLLPDETFIKLEHLQLGGSHKARAARRVIAAAEAEGALKRDGKHLIIEKSGGNFGLGLATYAVPCGYPVKLVVRPAFSAYRRYLLAQLGADLIGRKEMASGCSNKEIIDLHMASYRHMGLVPFFTDQFNNQACIEAHEEGASEYVSQLIECGVSPEETISLVKCVGSGASLCAYERIFRRTFSKVRVVVVQPKGCDFKTQTFVDHPFEGAAVGLTPPFFTRPKLDDFITIEHADALTACAELFATAGIFAGRTTGLAFAAAKSLRTRGSGPIVILAYDGGEAYAADAFRRCGDSDATCSV
ncbi:pyridoxal-phosphate dependent enzyme [Bradyrhizobium oligotrophicum]|uniref:pyridoxal-phosphate dependent enzyme n=1 Tax=Bradyrhizobium oligotrophicum TaxID=44255 RepID=UPI003EBC7CA2